MPHKRQELVSAQVVLRPASGKPPDGQAIITAETLKDFLPSPETVATVPAAFSALGFDVGPVVGNGFSLTAPVERFEEVFQVRLQRQGNGSIQALGEEGARHFELPLHALPRHLAEKLVAVTFTPPPDFGPTRFGA
jgi:hypothetical protein